MYRPIAISLSPNTESDDVSLALQMLCQPWRWKNGKAAGDTEEWFLSYFPGYSAVSFNSGRSALLAILQAFGIGLNDEVLIQAFTCVAVPNSVRWNGAKPVYVDIDATLNIDPEDIEKNLTPRSKAIIVQHTFGIPAQMDRIVAIARKHKLRIIEDCAHALGATYKGEKVGTLGDAAFFSFGRDKVVSSVFGGMAIIKNTHKLQCIKLRKYQEKLPYPSNVWILQQLLHPVAFSLILPLYTRGIGKLLLVMLQKTHMLSFPVYAQEKRGERPPYFPAKIPDALALLARHQLTKLKRFNQQRVTTAAWYHRTLGYRSDISMPELLGGSVFLRFPILAANPRKVRERARKQGVILGNWYHHCIDPEGVNYQSVGYRPGACPRAEYAASHIVNLPTNITLDEAHRVVTFL